MKYLLRHNCTNALMDNIAVTHGLKTLLIIILTGSIALVWPDLRYCLPISVLLAQTDLTIEYNHWSKWQDLCKYYSSVFIVLVLLVAISAAVALVPLGAWLWLIVVGASSGYLSYSNQQFWALGLIANLLCLITLTMVAHDPAHQVPLVYSTLSAGLIVFLVQLIFVVQYVLHAPQYLWQDFWHKLSSLQNLIFTFNPNESAWHHALSSCFINLTYYRKSNVYPELRAIWQISVRLASLRYRLQDKSLLAANSKIFTQIQRQVQQVMLNIKTQALANPADLAQLSSAIDALENLYYNVFVSALTDPEVILLFILDLRDLTHQLSQFKSARLATGGWTELVQKKFCSPQYLPWHYPFRNIVIICSAFLSDCYFQPTAALPITAIVAMVLYYANYNLALTHGLLKGLCCLLLLYGGLLVNTYWYSPIIVLISIIGLAVSAKQYLHNFAVHFADTAFISIIFLTLSLLSPNLHPAAIFTDVIAGITISSLGLLFSAARVQQVFTHQAMVLLRTIQQWCNAHSCTPKFIPHVREFAEQLWLSGYQYYPTWIFTLSYNNAVCSGQQYFTLTIWQLIEIITLDLPEQQLAELPELLVNSYCLIGEVCGALIALVQGKPRDDGGVMHLEQKLAELNQAIVHYNDFNLDLIPFSAPDLARLRYVQQVVNLHQQLTRLLALL